MTRNERVMLIVVIGLAACLLAKLSYPLPTDFDLGPFAFWVGVTLISSFAPVNLPGGVLAYLNTAPLLAARYARFGIAGGPLLTTWPYAEERIG